MSRLISVQRMKIRNKNNEINRDGVGSKTSDLHTRILNVHRTKGRLFNFKKF